MKKTITALFAVSMLMPATQAQAHHSSSYELPRYKDRHKYELGSKFIDRLAWCETHADWDNGGNWAGGLGIARSTWRAYGGRQFASTPDKATKREQVIIANRIALWGFLRRDGRYVFPVGLSGWGALKCAFPVSIIKRRIDGSFGADDARKVHR